MSVFDASESDHQILMCSRLSIFQNIFYSRFFHRSEIETFLRSNITGKGSMDQTPVPGPVPGVTVLQRELRTGHGDQIFLNFSNCLSPGSTFSRNL